MDNSNNHYSQRYISLQFFTGLSNQTVYLIELN